MTTMLINTNIVLFLSLLSCSMLLHHRYLMGVDAKPRAKRTKKAKKFRTSDPTSAPDDPTLPPFEPPNPTPPEEDAFDCAANETYVLELNAAAMEAYTFFYPLLVVNYTARSAEASLPPEIRNTTPGGDPLPFFNTIDNSPDTVNVNFTTVVNPNADNLYSQAWIDIHTEAMVLTLPAVFTNWTRFFVAQLQDMWSNTFANPGTRTMINGGNGSYVGKTDFILCLAESNQCDGLGDLSGTSAMIIPVATSYIWMITRTQVLGTDFGDETDLHAFQQQYKLSSLSNWTRGDLPLEVLNVAPKGTPGAPSPNNVTESFRGCRYFTEAADMWYYNQNTEITDKMNATLALLKMAPGKPPPCDDPQILHALNVPPGSNWKGELGLLGLENLCSAGAGPGCNKIGGWDWYGLATIGNYSTDYETRALVAKFGLGGNLNADAMYYVAPAPGQNLFQGSYVISFPVDPTLHTKAFWSITIYNEKKFVVGAPDGYPNEKLGVCIINNMNTDIFIDPGTGYVTIYLQREKPVGYPDSANWLCTPADNEPFQMTFRGYWPDNTFVEFTFPMAGIYTTLNELPCKPPVNVTMA